MAHGLGQASGQALARMFALAALKKQSYTVLMLNSLIINQARVNTLSDGGLEAPAGSRLLLSNCLDVLNTLPDESIDCIITDPPYGINYQSRSHSLALTKIAGDDGQEAYALLDQALALAYNKLKPDRHVYIFTNWQAYEAMAPIVRKYFKLKGTLAWNKHSWTRGDLKGNYGYQYEMMLYAHKGRRFLSGKRDGDVLCFDKVPSNHMQHPTEKPVALLEYLIQKSTLPGEMVLDPFMGSGSTCVAAEHTGRQYIGVELEPAWFEVAVKRLETETSPA